MDKRILIALGLIVIIFGVYQFFGQSIQKEEQGVLRVSVAAVKENTKLYAVDAEYPQFDGVSDSFNKSIADFAESNISDFKSASAENWQARQDTLPPDEPKQEFPDKPFDFILNWDLEQLSGNYISFIARFEEYVGGANEIQNLKTFNYDLKNNKEIALADLFLNTPDYLNKISDIVRSDLISELNAASEGHTPTEMINQGTEPTLENFSNFVFNDQTITFYFPKYQVAPGVFGEQNAPISFENIK
ncbi:MAG: DUF3298 domain-containing protein [Minisyncoccia bacterium]